MPHDEIVCKAMNAAFEPVAGRASINFGDFGIAIARRADNAVRICPIRLARAEYEPHWSFGPERKGLETGGWRQRSELARLEIDEAIYFVHAADERGARGYGHCHPIGAGQQLFAFDVGDTTQIDGIALQRLMMSGPRHFLLFGDRNAGLDDRGANALFLVPVSHAL